LTKIRDITDTWNQQQVIQQAEQRYRRLVQLSPDGIAVHQDGRIVFVNPAGARLLGYAHPDEMTGLPVLDVVHPDDRAAVVQRITSALRDGRAGAPAGERFRRKDGTWQPVEVLNAPYVWDGRPAVLVICRDTGERDRLRIQAEHAAAHARAIIAASPAAVAAELDGRIVYANQRFADLYGYGAAEVVGLGVDAIIAAHDRARVAGYTKARRAGQDAPSEYHFTGLRRDGTTLDVAIVVTTYELHGQQYTLGFLRPV
ncbi:PAS domain S-box protein, partial [candidate division WOR-3 bacterium]|nr:PAS domain S-box protein [candidate division WOR-3 bacterium]